MELVERSGAGQSVRALLNPWSMLRNLWRHRELAYQVAARDVQGRYRNSMLGLLWAVLTPLALLAIYTFVFSVVLKTRWGRSENESAGEFAVTLFCGMLVFNLFSEVVTRSATLVTNNPNFVKKVVFPLEVFVPAALLTALFNFLVGLLVWVVAWMIVVRAWPSVSLAWLPVVLAPVCLTTLGVSWLLSSLGVFVRDVGHGVSLVVQLLFFATPVFYRLDVVKEPYRTILMLNPLTHAVEDARRVMMGPRYWALLGQPEGLVAPDWPTWVASLIVSGVVAVLGYAFFVKSKRAFADVI